MTPNAVLDSTVAGKVTFSIEVTTFFENHVYLLCDSQHISYFPLLREGPVVSASSSG